MRQPVPQVWSDSAPQLGVQCIATDGTLSSNVTVTVTGGTQFTTLTGPFKGVQVGKNLAAPLSGTGRVFGEADFAKTGVSPNNHSSEPLFTGGPPILFPPVLTTVQ